MRRIVPCLVLVVGGIGCAGPQAAPPASGPGPATSVQRVTDGALVRFNEGILKLEVCAAEVVRVAYAKNESFFARKSLAAQPKKCEGAPFDFVEASGAATLSTAKLKVRADLATGRVSFLDASGAPVLEESARTVMPAVVMDESTNHVRQEWTPADGEALYGLGENQIGLLDIKGYDLDLWQHNGTIVIPFLVSSRGWGVLWDNTSYTRFGDLRPWEPIPAERVIDANGQVGGFSAQFYKGTDFKHLVGERVDRVIDIQLSSKEKKPNSLIFAGLPEGNASVRWTGDVDPPVTGDYQFQTFSNSGIKMWIDDKLVINHWRQGWLPWKEVARTHLEAGKRAKIRLEWSKDQNMETVQLLWKQPSPTPPTTSLWSEVGDGVDYYFVYGPELDAVVAGYRRVTGPAPMVPKWALGLWQSRQRYETQKQSLEVVDGFRKRGIPFDTIVQDWFYWKENAWGSQDFDPARFPDPDKWVRDIHAKHARVMISVWGKYYPGTKNFEAMRTNGFLYHLNLAEGLRDWVGDGGYPYTFYDAFNPEAGKLFWSQMNGGIFSKHVDAWWLDAPEPDLLPTPTLEGQRTHMNPTALGSGARMLNAYSLVNSKTVYEGQRGVAPDQRVFILTRSAFAGQQHYGAAVWSGDISSTWTALRAQIPAGLGLSVSGLPYWSMDIGGFSVPERFSTAHPTADDVEEWRELNARWFEFGTFVPLLRVHGEAPKREMWEFGGDSSPAYHAQLKFDRVRYRLLPYIYSLAGGVTQEGGTIMRPLVMDFRTDAKVREVSDQYMFGPALLISPVTTYKTRSRSVYLPIAAGGWYDFWSGGAAPAGEAIDVSTPYDSIPVHVRAGAIIPAGPEIQYSDEKPADPTTLWVYAGADGAFTLYEDDGLTYGYERGQFARIPFHWSDATRTLTIGKREGAFTAMAAQRTFDIVLVAKDKAVGFSFTPKADKSVKYDGNPVDVKM